ncbi:hypothetical protein GW17_00013320 [Ensete ventricosum]|nr:hypothetical protein GW17_00013320 [Ensete ventricosum]
MDPTSVRPIAENHLAQENFQIVIRPNRGAVCLAGWFSRKTEEEEERKLAQERKASLLTIGQGDAPPSEEEGCSSCIRVAVGCSGRLRVELQSCILSHSSVMLMLMLIRECSSARLKDFASKRKKKEKEEHDDHVGAFVEHKATRVFCHFISAGGKGWESDTGCQ